MKKVTSLLIGIIIVIGVVVAGVVSLMSAPGCSSFGGIACVFIIAVALFITVVAGTLALVAHFKVNTTARTAMYILILSIWVIIAVGPPISNAVGSWTDSRVYYEGVGYLNSAGDRFALYQWNSTTKQFSDLGVESAVVLEDKTIAEKYGTKQFVAVYRSVFRNSRESKYIKNETKYIKSARDLSEYHGYGKVGKIIKGSFVKGGSGLCTNCTPEENAEYSRTYGYPYNTQFQDTKGNVYYFTLGEFAFPNGVPYLPEKISALVKEPGKIVKVEATENGKDSLLIKWVYN